MIRGMIPYDVLIPLIMVEGIANCKIEHIQIIITFTQKVVSCKYLSILTYAQDRKSVG